MSVRPTMIVQHSDHPEWGRGVILAPEAGRTDRVDLSFERGGRRAIMKSFSAKLVPVELPADEAAALGEKLANRRAASAAKTPGKKPSKTGATAPTLTSFDAQLAAFLAAYPDGFQGETFTKAVRGAEGAKAKKTDTAPGLALAAASLSAEAFAKGDTAALFAAATELVRSTAFVHPLEGANLLGTMAEANRPAFVAALKDLLHGTGDFEDRFEAFVASLKLGGEGKDAKRPSWPLATVFSALVHPTEHVCVKPTVFQKQAALVRVPLDYQPVPSAGVYAQMKAVTTKTLEALKAAGQSPRDLVDVASFIGLTQSAKPAAGKA